MTAPDNKTVAAGSSVPVDVVITEQMVIAVYSAMIGCSRGLFDAL